MAIARRRSVDQYDTSGGGSTAPQPDGDMATSKWSIGGLQPAYDNPDSPTPAPLPPEMGYIPSGPDIDNAIGIGGPEPEFNQPQAIDDPVGPSQPQEAIGAPTGPAAPPPAPTPLSGGMTSQTASQSLQQQLQQILGNPAGFNQGVVDSRVESARENVDRFRNSQLDTMMAQLAERGLVGSGGEFEGRANLEEQLAGIFGTSLRDIYADASQAGDDQVVELISLATGLSVEEAKRAVEMYAAQTADKRVNNEWDMFTANYGLDQQRLANDMGDDELMMLIRLLAMSGGG
jgi:hypothetical protein